MSDDIHFDVKDYAGRIIICTEIQWEDHVLGPNHRNMEGCETEVISALQAPNNQIRYVDRKYSNRRVYYKDCFDYLTKVVIGYEDEKCNGIGYLFTAYMTDRIPKGEIPEI